MTLLNHQFVSPIPRTIGSVPAERSLAKQSRRILFYFELLVLDMLALIVGPILANSVLTYFDDVYRPWLPSLAIIPIYIVIAVNNGAYSMPALRRALDSIRLSLPALIVANFAMLMMAFVLQSSVSLSRLGFVAAAISSTLLLIVGRYLLVHHVRSVTGGKLTNELLILDGRPASSAPDGVMVIDAGLSALSPDLQNPVMLDRFGQLAGLFDRIVIDSVPERRHQWSLLLKGANIDGEILMEESSRLGAIGIGTFVGRESVLVARKPLSMRNRFRKRLLDLSITVPTLFLLLPVFGFVAIAIKLDSSGPVFFRQDRVGRGNRLFKVLKFRSMRVESCDANGTRSASRTDDRVTRVGRFLRSTSIDELPQLLNVLFGEMSLVGPRPHALGSQAGERLFWEIDETYWHRHQLKPGITGLAQVRGFRGATVELSDLTKRLEADMEYIQEWGIWRDIDILVNTFRVLIHRNAF